MTAEEWRDRAHCLDRYEPHDWWFDRHQAVALAHCASCPVARPCLNAALKPVPGVYDPRGREGGRPTSGIFAGTTPSDRLGKGLSDVDELLEMARARAVSRGLAPAWSAA
jgi:hypothetical protein